VDVVVVVSAPPDQQRARVLQRPNMTPDKLDQVLARQMPDAKKRARADFIVDTGGTLAETDAQVDNIVESLRGRTGTAFATAWA
jgi:dephospho-CoA kinase